MSNLPQKYLEWNSFNSELNIQIHTNVLGV